jgi:hypothetical protein
MSTVDDALAILVSAFPHKEVSKPTLLAYKAGLRDLHPDLLKAAVVAVVQEHTYPTLPTVAAIRERAAELAAPDDLSAEAAWEQLQAWGRSGPRSEKTLHPDILVTISTFGQNAAWSLTDTTTPMKDRGFQRAAFISAWNDWRARKARVQRTARIAQLTGIELKKIGAGA